jgi:hypothetical protein
MSISQASDGPNSDKDCPFPSAFQDYFQIACNPSVDTLFFAEVAGSVDDEDRVERAERIQDHQGRLDMEQSVSYGSARRATWPT